ncbi:Sodium/sulfate symporter [Radiomyces spectabilis]|uniref:Sodium/sulfate symporter n=1 Tax=Radiomyces spectabilis TaxID=64574 RepID=UPI00221E4FC1|nr:Sodium/sulfate symporter [Radiomyces spectabilis]KAI8374689.1 Sodium/sulfate symporter [Radiomyces spectabilis]
MVESMSHPPVGPSTHIHHTVDFDAADEHSYLLGHSPGTPQRSIWDMLKTSQAVKLLPSVFLGVVIWFGITPTDELSVTAIHLLAVFVSCIFALITTSVDISLLVLTALTLLSVTHSFQCIDHATGQGTECRLCGEPNPLTGEMYDCKGGKEAFLHSLEGFSSSVVWLIFAAFHLGKAVEVTQLGRRLSLLMIRHFGRRIMGLAYAIVLSELLLAPFVPSNTARGGGIVLPVVLSIARSLGSTPSQDPLVGGFLMLVGAHTNFLSASMYLTGMAPNPIVVAKANQLFPDLNFSFVTWIQGSIVPALFCALCIPFILQYACGLSKTTPQSRASSDNVIKHAEAQLARMGPMSLREWQLCAVLFMCLGLWITASYTKLDSTLVALIGLVALLHMGTITWKDISNNTHAWDTLFWLGGFVTIAQQLSEAGASSFLGQKISQTINDLGLPPVPCLALAYFLTTFMFSSLSAHTVAFVGTFLDAGHALGAQPMVLTALLAYFGALGGCMTNFSTGTAAMYYAPGYISRSKWFIIGAQMAVFYLTVYFTLGMGWWKLLGWY